MPFLNVYLNYNGNCEEAFNHYKSVFGGEFSMFSRFSDMPSGEEPMPASEADKILHVSLPVGTAGCVLMGSDCPPSFTNGIQGNLSPTCSGAPTSACALISLGCSGW